MTGGKPKLRKGYRETIESARAYAESHGATLSYDLVGKHPSVIVTKDGRTASACFPSTPRAPHYEAYGRRAARQALERLEGLRP